ncbi:hypothetical protein BJ508DRAFT_315225 [Ascobolus immersus RN42]|uniref:Uncharacterized protein n=1 Tax=Ascobolus immersus RN42 TaxID=1160509 RepID=A0A3N4HBR3_ASCIM|nr:hypothetical protein BJ508DRAFT_315225 [Ascobolus immersus RN42]
MAKTRPNEVKQELHSQEDPAIEALVTALSSFSFNGHIDEEDVFHYSDDHIPKVQVEPLRHLNWFYETWLATHMYPTYSTPSSRPITTLCTFSITPKPQGLNIKRHLRIRAPLRRRAIGVPGSKNNEVLPEATIRLHRTLGPKWYYVLAPGARRRVAREIELAGFPRRQVYPSTLFAQALSDWSGRYVGGYAVTYFAVLLGPIIYAGKEVARAGTKAYFRYIVWPGHTIVSSHLIARESDVSLGHMLRWRRNYMDPAYQRHIGDIDLELERDPGYWYPLIESPDGEQTVMIGQHPLTDVRRGEEYLSRGS